MVNNTRKCCRFLRGFIINSNEDVAPPQRMFTGGFTLIELLLVISVLTVLFALVLPVISSSKRRAKVMGCGNNIRQFCLASQMYAQSNPRRLPILIQMVRMIYRGLGLNILGRSRPTVVQKQKI